MTRFPTLILSVALSDNDIQALSEWREATIATLQAELAQARKDADRYRWLRDKSIPPQNFYLSVPAEFRDVYYMPLDVDTAIDAALQAGD